MSILDRKPNKEIPCPICNKIVRIWYEPVPSNVEAESELIAMSFIDHFNRNEHTPEELRITLAGMIAFEALGLKVFLTPMN
jgi:hypothetical protein